MLAPPSVEGPKSAFVDISQDALGAGDISETCSLRGLEDREWTPWPLLQAQMGLGHSATHHTSPAHPCLRKVSHSK